MPIANVNGISLAYEVAGAGEPLVLISGLGYDRWQWHLMVPILSRSFQVVTIDNRGAGESSKPPGPYTAWMLADDTAALIAHLGLGRPHVMGHSMGGFVAQALAIRHASSLDRLILAATNFGGPRHVPISPEAMAVLTDVTSDPLQRLRRGVEVSTAPGFVSAHPEFLDEWLRYRTAHPIDPLGYQAQLAIGLGLLAEAAALESLLPGVRAPTLILFGDSDKVVPPANAALLAAQIRDSRVGILERAGHFFPFEVADAASRAVVDFLLSPSRAGA